MIKLLALLAVALVLAHISERNTKAVLASGGRYSVWGDWAYILLVVIFVLFSGLRTQYNDTQNYIAGFEKIPVLTEFFADSGNLNPFLNPLFLFYQSALKMVTDDPQILIFTSSLFSQACFIRFFKRYADDFPFSIFIYVTLGTFSLTLAAIKQVLAMAVLTLAFPYLQRKQWFRYYFIVLVAMLIHTYALAFAVLPLFSQRPWKLLTYLFAAVIALIIMNFRAVITSFLKQADELGKSIAELEVFDDHTINIFRLAVYAVVPLISFVFQRWIFWDSSDMDHILAHMSIISLAFMAMGTQSGANLFGRMANYFELGTICCLPTMLKRTFTDRSYRIISGIAVLCFMGFFIYANAINMDFDREYLAISLWDFIKSLF